MTIRDGTQVVRGGAVSFAGSSLDSDFARAVQAGLSRLQKSVPCTWLYDRVGSELFERITTLPEYYPTRMERLILRRCAPQIGALIGPRACLIELGSGSSHKTGLLLAVLEAPACYVPIDISAQYMQDSVCALRTRFASLPIYPWVADFTRLGAPPPEVDAGDRRVVFFPGSTLGNLMPSEAVDLLRRVARLAGKGGLLVLGVDSTQDPAVLLPAYDDAQGVTSAFNKNLLVRMNRELDAGFDVESFDHIARFDARAPRVEMHLVSRRKQVVRVADADFTFQPGESIHTESAYKYALPRIRSLAGSAGWTPRQLWTDATGCYGVHVFECTR